MNMTNDLRGDINKSINEIPNSKNKEWNDMKKTVKAMQMGMESKIKTQTEEHNK